MNPSDFPTTTNCATAPCTVQASTFYPPIRMRGTQGVSLQPLCIGICFSGALPRNLVRGIVVPIHISVSIAEEYRPFTTPVMEALSLDGYPHSSSGSSGISCDEALVVNEIGHERLSCDHVVYPDIPIPFLPLQKNFDPADSHHWSQLSEQIQRWLVTVPADSQHWTWGRDAFWLAFVGACPDFPAGRWLRWDARIPLEGQFIEQWVSVGPTTLGGDQTRESLLEQIWAEFCVHAMLFYPDPLVSID